MTVHKLCVCVIQPLNPGFSHCENQEASRWSWWTQSWFQIWSHFQIHRSISCTPDDCISPHFSLTCRCQVSRCSSAGAVQAAGGSLNLVDFPVSYLQASRCLIWLVYFWLSAFKDTDRACVRVCGRERKRVRDGRRQHWREEKGCPQK